MPLRFADRGATSADWNAAAGSNVGAAPWVEPLLDGTIETWGTNPRWTDGTNAEGTSENIDFVSGGPRLYNSILLGTWRSRLYDTRRWSVFRQFRAGVDAGGGTVRWAIRIGGHPRTMEDQAWQTLTPNSLLTVTPGRFYQLRAVLDPTGAVPGYPLVNYASLEHAYAPARDPATGLLDPGQVQQRAERAFSQFGASVSDFVLANASGWWNPTGRLTPIVGTVFSSLARERALAGTAGTYEAWMVGTGVTDATRNKMIMSAVFFDDLNAFSNDFYAFLREGAGTSRLDQGTKVTAAIGTNSLYGPPHVIDPWIGTGALQVTIASDAPGTSGARFRPDESYSNMKVFANWSAYIKVLSTTGSPPLDLIFRSAYPANGTMSGTTRIAFADLPTATFTRVNVRGYGTVNPNGMIVDLDVVRPATGEAMTLLIAGVQFTRQVVEAGTTLQTLVSPTEHYWLHGPQYQRRGTIGAAGTTFVPGASLTAVATLPAHNERQRIVCGPSFETRAVRSWPMALEGGYRLGWTGSAFGTEETIPMFRGQLTGGLTLEEHRARFHPADTAAELLSRTSERVNQDAGTAGTRYWEGQTIHALVEELLTYGAGWGTNDSGTINRRAISPVEFGTRSVPMGSYTGVPGVQFGLWYDLGEAAPLWIPAGTTWTGTVYAAQYNSLYRKTIAANFNTWTLVGTMDPASGWRFSHILGRGMSALGTVVFVKGYDNGTHAIAQWELNTGTFTHWLTFGTKLASVYSVDRRLVRQGTSGLWFYVDVDPVAGGTTIGLYNKSAGAGAGPGGLSQTLVSGALAADTTRFATAAISPAGTTGTGFVIAVDRYLLAWRFTTDYGTIGTLFRGTFANVDGLVKHPTRQWLMAESLDGGTRYLNLFDPFRPGLDDLFLLGGGTIYERIGTLGTSAVRQFLQEPAFPWRLFILLADGHVLETQWNGTCGTLQGTMSTDSRQVGLVHAPAGTSLLLYVGTVASGDIRTLHGARWITPRLGTADWGAAPVSSVLGELAEAGHAVTRVNEDGVFVFAPRAGTRSITGTLEGARLHGVRLRDGEGAENPVITDMTYGLLTQPGTTRVTDSAAQGTIGTRAWRIANPWIADFDDANKRAVISAYLRTYSYPALLLDVSTPIDFRRTIGEHVRVRHALMGLSDTHEWEIVGVTHEAQSWRTSLTLREWR